MLVRDTLSSLVLYGYRPAKGVGCSAPSLPGLVREVTKLLEGPMAPLGTVPRKARVRQQASTMLPLLMVPEALAGLQLLFPCHQAGKSHPPTIAGNAPWLQQMTPSPRAPQLSPARTPRIPDLLPVRPWAGHCLSASQFPPPSGILGIILHDSCGSGPGPGSTEARKSFAQVQISKVDKGGARRKAKLGLNPVWPLGWG